MQLGALQNANAVNFVHILERQAEHIAAVIARSYEVGAMRVEPTAEAEDTCVRTVHATSPDMRAFAAACTPGYYDGEGTASATSVTFSPGPIVFHRLLEGGMGDVLVKTEELAAIGS
ncbi:MAG: hypothetical protein ACTHMF_17070 [Leifsonia sp.]|uniref:hypothetical protein n=1 Tax=Leifsonia sp. TaxID=1870902 RepID=UPI003F7E3FD1